ncbi:MAG: sugar O-acetyltransferase [Casimicrobiaceae bacterium]
MTTARERMIAGESYDPHDAELVALRQHAHGLCRDLDPTPDVPSAARRMILDALFAAANGVYIQPPFFCDYGFNIRFGPGCYLNVNCVLLDVCAIDVGARVLFGPAAQVYTATHPLDAIARRTVEHGAPVRIGDDVWIGGGAIICPGVTIGARTVIGAGAVVVRDVPDDVLAVGNPCRVVRTLR